MKERRMGRQVLVGLERAFWLWFGRRFVWIVPVCTLLFLLLIWWQAISSATVARQLIDNSAQAANHQAAVAMALHLERSLGDAGKVLAKEPQETQLLFENLDELVLRQADIVGYALFDHEGKLIRQFPFIFGTQTDPVWLRVTVSAEGTLSQQLETIPAGGRLAGGVLMPTSIELSARSGIGRNDLRRSLLLFLDRQRLQSVVQRLIAFPDMELSVLDRSGQEVLRMGQGEELATRTSFPPGLLVASGALGERGSMEADDEHGLVRLYSLARSEALGIYTVAHRDAGTVRSGKNGQAGAVPWWSWLATLATLLGAIAVGRAAVQQKKIADGLRRTEAENRELISKLQGEKQKAFQLAYFDQSTGLANRSYFMLMASDRLATARRRKQQSAILFLDLDGFKCVNDTHGHRVGDALLGEIGRRLQGTLRQSDLVSRFGGDEFVIQVGDMDRAEQLHPLAQKLIALISMPFRYGTIEVQVGVSIGISVFPQDGEMVNELIRFADSAMYESKRAGSSGYRFFDAELNVRMARRAVLEKRLKAAIEKREFVLHFQPRVSSSGYEISSLEALVRWQHPELGLVYPNDFIPLAEETGRIVALGQLVIELACEQIVAWRQQGVDVPPVAVNVSPKQLRNDLFSVMLARALSRYSLPFSALEIEVTESCVMDDPDRVARTLGELRDKGLRVSLDDYGTGYSSLASIKSLPLYAIKIDRTFVADIGTGANDDVIVASTISMCRGLGLRAVAEGVENLNQLIRLRTLGCEEVQGYLFNRPLPASELLPFLKQGKCLPLGLQGPVLTALAIELEDRLLMQEASVAGVQLS